MGELWEMTDSQDRVLLLFWVTELQPVYCCHDEAQTLWALIKRLPQHLILMWCKISFIYAAFFPNRLLNRLPKSQPDKINCQTIPRQTRVLSPLLWQWTSLTSFLKWKCSKWAFNCNFLQSPVRMRILAKRPIFTSKSHSDMQWVAVITQKALGRAAVVCFSLSEMFF